MDQNICVLGGYIKCSPLLNKWVCGFPVTELQCLCFDAGLSDPSREEAVRIQLQTRKRSDEIITKGMTNQESRYLYSIFIVSQAPSVSFLVFPCVWGENKHSSVPHSARWREPTAQMLSSFFRHLLMNTRVLGRRAGRIDCVALLSAYSQSPACLQLLKYTLEYFR